MKYIKQINEEFLGIDIDDIKKKAYEYHKTKEWRSIMSGIDIETLNSVESELYYIENKWGNVDNLAERILNKGESKNETIFNTILLATFGIHAFMKFLVAIKNNRSFLRYLGSIFCSSKRNYDIKTVRDLCISITFCMYLIVYTISNHNYFVDYYSFGRDIIVTVEWKWSGLNDFLLKDGVGKEYFCKKNGIRKFDVYYKGNKIGIIHKDDFYNLSGEKILFDVEDNTENIGGKHINVIDLENLFKGKVTDKKIKEIEKRNLQIRKLQNEIDSLKLTENVDQAKKVIKNLDMEYSELSKYIVKNPVTNLDKRRNNKIKVFLEIKDILEKNNNVGYLGLFATIIFKNEPTYDGYHDSILNLYKDIISLNDIISQLRDNDGNLKSLITFTSYEELNDALLRLKSWRIVNEFMRKIPAEQKNLIWQNKYFIEKNKSQFLTNCILKINNSYDLSKLFLRKVSSIKTAEAFISVLENITNETYWDYDSWLKKLNKTKNVYITWCSKEKNKIICVVTTHSAIKKIAFMTNWCIVRNVSSFNRYESKGLQCILYNFDYPITDDESVVGFTTRLNGCITDCHNKFDNRTRLPNEFYDTERECTSYYNDVLKMEYLKINWAKVLLKMDTAGIRIIRKFISQKINNNKRLSNFIDFYESE